LVAFGALVGRWWALWIVALPFALIALLFTLSGTIEDHDGDFAGPSIAAVVLLAGAGALLTTSVGVLLGEHVRHERAQR